jgi:hypothetical protein
METLPKRSKSYRTRNMHNKKKSIADKHKIKPGLLHRQEPPRTEPELSP